VDFEIVWKTIQRDLPSLYFQIQKAMRDINDQDDVGMQH
jgi:uncharacterized protein with HEPN domain